MAVARAAGTVADRDRELRRAPDLVCSVRELSGDGHRLLRLGEDGTLLRVPPVAVRGGEPVWPDRRHVSALLRPHRSALRAIAAEYTPK